MEQLIAGAQFPAKCVKNEIHNLLTTLRLTKHRSTGREADFHASSLEAFQRLFEELTYIHELHEFDTVAYLGPFLEVIQSDASDGQITGVALDAVDKFVSFGLIRPDSPRCGEAVNMLAWGVINCRFVASAQANGEVVLMKMVGLMIDCLRCPAGDYLGDQCVWHMVRKCFQISRQPRASHLLRSSAEGVLQQMVLTIFGTHKRRAQNVRVSNPGTDAAPESGAAGALAPSRVEVLRPYGYKAMHFVLRFLAFLLAYGRSGSVPQSDKAKPRPRKARQRSRSPGSPPGGRRAPSEDAEQRSTSPQGPAQLGLKESPKTPGSEEEHVHTHCLGLSLLNVALESGGEEIAKSDDLISVIQDDICKSLLQNSRTDSLSVLSLTLRAIFNLFLNFRRHLKVQLEIFFTSVHLKIAALDSASYDQREIALESLLEFCREPELMLELFTNYDCDVRCTNLFETLVKFLVTHAFPSDGAGSSRSGGSFNSLHRLALSGLTSILHSVALRCEQHRHFRPAEEALQPPAGAETAEPTGQLQRKKEQKRRLAMAARSFNSEPSKCMPALQGLGLVSNPPTPESMAEFLRHTPQLDLRMVGEYLAKRKDFNQQVNKAFMELFAFNASGIVEALRAVLGAFRLPGEAQLIERLMESFATAYFVNQPPVMDDGEDAGGDAADGAKPSDPAKVTRWIAREKSAEEVAEAEGVRETGGGTGGPEDPGADPPMRMKMANSDTVFILSYAIIMLNTDLHNPGVKVKMSFEAFVRNNRGIDNGKNVPEFFLKDIYEAIRDDEIRLHGDAPVEGAGAHDEVVDDFFWEGILRRSESIDEFATTGRLLCEAPPGATERDMLQVVLDCQPLPTLSLCYESAPDISLASDAMMAFQDLARINAYFHQADAVNSLARVMCQYFARASAGGQLTVRSQIALRAAQQCVAQYAPLFKEAEWCCVLEVLLQLRLLDLLPSHLTELDDFAGTDGTPLESLCDLRPPFAPPQPDGRPVADSSRVSAVAGAQQGPALRQESTDGFLESLARWFEDETRSDDEELGTTPSAAVHSGALAALAAPDAPSEDLPVSCTDPAEVFQQVKQWVARSGFVELFTSAGVPKLPAESLQVLAKALVSLARPVAWSTGGGTSPAGGAGGEGPASGLPTADASAAPLGAPPGPAASWHEVADPVVCLELLTNMTCMPLGPGQNVSQIWPLVSTHFERLLQHVIAGEGSTERQFIERLIVNTLRLCIRLIGNADLVPTLLSLVQHLSRLPPRIFATYSERIACGLVVLVRDTQLPHTGLSVIFALLKRISDSPSGVGACSAGMECLNYWLSDDQELSRLMSLQLFHELLSTLKAFASQSSGPASQAALENLSSLVPQLARGSRSVTTAAGDWQSLWVPTMQALADIAKKGSQRSSAQAFVHLQRLLLERDTGLSVPWERVPFEAWQECLEQVLFPLLQAQPSADVGDAAVPHEVADARRASTAQLSCSVVLTHSADWHRSSPDGFPVLFLRLLHVLVSEASKPSTAQETLRQSLKNLLLVISCDPSLAELKSQQAGQTLLEAAWGVVSQSLPGLREEISMILNPPAMDAPEAVSPPAAQAMEAPEVASMAPQ